jgi:hypothetical protein
MLTPGCDDRRFGRSDVWLIVFYVVFMIIGDLASYLIGLGVEHFWPIASLPVFLFFYFFFLWVAWILAVRITNPKPELTGNAASA